MNMKVKNNNKTRSDSKEKYRVLILEKDKKIEYKTKMQKIIYIIMILDKRLT